MVGCQKKAGRAYSGVSKKKQEELMVGFKKKKEELMVGPGRGRR
jgi:hypothetical protein